MKFSSACPDIPARLLRAHEDNRVVFFCGAGISMGAGLPNFKGLLKQVQEKIGSRPDAIEQRLRKEKKYDCAFGYLERKLGKPEIVRESIRECLMPNTDESQTHKSLLALARTRNGTGSTRLVTTNFDRLFELIRGDCPKYEAPALPLPNDDDWDGVVYLHGLLSANPGQSLRQLVVTNGDFGRAYLLDRWASRFVGDILQNYVVCFVGYSMSDPVMHYLIDAIDSGSEMGGKDMPSAYMFIPEEEIENNDLERNRAIQFIGYNSANRHEALHQTLVLWADYWVKGLSGKKDCVKQFAPQDPSFLKDEASRGQLIWALSEKTGNVAKFFAELVPAPHFGWLNVILAEHEDRVSAETDCQWLSLDSRQRKLTPREIGLREWLIRYLNHPGLISYVLKCRALDYSFRSMVSVALDRFSTLKGKNDIKALADIAKRSPFAIPDEYAERVWRLILSGRILTDELAWWQVARCLKLDLDADRWNFMVKTMLQDCLTPRVGLRGSFSNKDLGSSVNVEDSFYIEFDLNTHLLSVLGKDKIKAVLKGRPEETIEICHSALRQGLGELLYLKPAAERDYAEIAISSIDKHPQNEERTHEWRFVVDLLRDAWLDLCVTNRAKASDIVREWFRWGGSVFSRLALFASRRSDVVQPYFWLEKLLGNNASLLWDDSARREVCRLLATTSQLLSEDDLKSLVEAIIQGGEACCADGSADARAKMIQDRSVWLRLKKIKMSGVKLPDNGEHCLNGLENKYGWELGKDEREEFPAWSWSSWNPSASDCIKHDAIPNDSDKRLIQWLSASHDDGDLYFLREDNWGDLCRTNPLLVMGVLKRMCRDNFSGATFLSKMTQTIMCCRDEDLLDYGLDLTTFLCDGTRQDLFRSNVSAIADLCVVAVKKNKISNELLIRIARRIFKCEFEDASARSVASNGCEAVAIAINHPVGKIVGALVDKCFPETIHKGDGIQSEYKDLFSEICQNSESRLIHGRVVLATQLLALYVADEDWVREKVFPLLDWNAYADAGAIWDGAIYLSRIDPPLLQELKSSFLETVKHLGYFKEEKRNRYITLLTYVALRKIRGYTTSILSNVFNDLAVADLNTVARTVLDYIRSGENGNIVKERWQQDVLPFMRNVWPKDVLKLTDDIRESLAQMAVYSLEDFPEALKFFQYAFTPFSEAYGVFAAIKKTDCHKHFPGEVMSLLRSILDRIIYFSKELTEILNEICTEHPNLERTADYVYLRNLIDEGM